MDDVESLKTQIKLASTRAINAKMNLHDLSEELPVNWETIPEVAQAATDAYRHLMDLKARLAVLSA
jgi:hypothetical protein